MVFADGKSRDIDMGGIAGDPPNAEESGRALNVGDGIKTFGLVIIIKRDSHFLTTYGNNQKKLLAI